MGSLPESVAIFDPVPLKEIADERAVLEQTIEADRCYVTDRLGIPAELIAEMVRIGGRRRSR